MNAILFVVQIKATREDGKKLAPTQADKVNALEGQTEKTVPSKVDALVAALHVPASDQE